MLVEGAIHAYLVPRIPLPFVHGAPQVARLFHDPRAEETAYYRRHGFYPIMHVVAVKPEVLDAHPDVAPMERTIALEPEAEWRFVVDRLNTHQAASLVRLVAQQGGIEADLGVHGKSGIIASMEYRPSFLQDPQHRGRFVYTPKHASWLNQVEIWVSILVRRLLKRARFRAVEELRQRLLAFIDYFNKTAAKPFKWTYVGRPLAAYTSKKLAPALY
jgi:transposase